MDGLRHGDMESKRAGLRDVHVLEHRTSWVSAPSELRRTV